MSLLIDTLYGILGLTDAEKAVVNSALPSIKDLLDAVDAHLDDVNTFEQLLITNKKPLKQLLVDWAVIGPNLSAACVDGSVDMFAILGAYNDVKTIMAANPKNVQAATMLFNKLVPVINQAIADWPNIKPAIQVIMTAAHRSNVSLDDMLNNVVDLHYGG